MAPAEPVKTALGGEWRTAGERGGVAERSGASREEKGDPSSVDPNGCLIWSRLRSLKHAKRPKVPMSPISAQLSAQFATNVFRLETS